jgi:spermidine synthase
MEEGTDSKSLIENGWFMEKNSQWPGQAMSLKVKEVLLHKKTDFQDLLVFQSTDWGKVLVLDGVIQLTEKDEMSYQEMMAHLPLFAHPNPKNVLILGGGDGGVTREVCKHACAEKITQCEIDSGVVEASKQFFPSVSCAYSNPKLNLIIGDGVEFAEKAEANTFDVIIIDSSDPVGPAEKLFSKEFYQNAERILKPGGVLCSQGECLWIHADLIGEMIGEHGAPFASAEYASIQVPTYPCGQIGAFLARKKGGPVDSCREPQRKVPDDIDLRYYSAEMHKAAFVLPEFIRRKLYGSEAAAKRQRT